MFDFLRPKRRRAEATVMGVRMASPHMRCITLGGAQIADFLDADGVDAPGAWVKVTLPSGEGRAYTISNINREARTLDLEFVLHESHGVSGPASAWARQARIGDQIGIAGPREGGFHLPTGASCILLAGDATALPAIKAIAQFLPPDIKGEVYAEVGSCDERQTIASAASLNITWLEEQWTPGAALRNALIGRRLPTDCQYVWIAGESGTVRALRGHYLYSLGLEPQRVSTKGYWKVGETAHRGG